MSLLLLFNGPLDIPDPPPAPQYAAVAGGAATLAALAGVRAEIREPEGAATITALSGRGRTTIQ